MLYKLKKKEGFTAKILQFPLARTKEECWEIFSASNLLSTTELKT